MPLEYLPPPSRSALRQGEIIADVWEQQPDAPPVELPAGSAISVHPVFHPRLMVMTAECDLVWDYEERISEHKQNQPVVSGRDHPSLMPHILLCELYEQAEVRGRVTGSDLWKRILQNQDERYHHLLAAPVGNPQVTALPDLYMDFKKTMSLPTHRLYEGPEGLQIIRVAVMPPIYLHDLMHRFYSFLGRVGLPE